MDTNITKTIQDLERQKAQIEAAIAALKPLNGHAVSTNGSGPTIMGAVLAHLRRVGSRQTSQQIREALAAAGVTSSQFSIQTVMSKRARQKKDLLHVGRGLWKLKRE